jgi:hypothetical protein
MTLSTRLWKLPKSTSKKQNIYNILLINMTQSCQIKQGYIEFNTGGVLFINKPYLILTYQMRMLTIILQLQLLQPKLYQCILNRIKKNNHSDVIVRFLPRPPYNFQNCRKFCQNILLLSEYAKNRKYMSSFNRDKGPTDKVHNKWEN